MLSHGSSVGNIEERMNCRITTYRDRRIVSYKKYIVKKHTLPNSTLDQVTISYVLEYPNIPP